MEKERTNVLLDKDMMIALKNLSQIENRSITSIVREAISEYIAKRNIKKDFTIIGIGESKKDSSNSSKLGYKENLRKKAGG